MMLISKKKLSFEDYLQDQHAKQYTGTDDCMPDDFNDWLCKMDVDDLIKMADEWGLQSVIYCNTVGAR